MSFQQRVIQVVQSHEAPCQEGRRCSSTFENISEVVESGTFRQPILMSRCDSVKLNGNQPSCPPATDWAATCSTDLAIFSQGLGSSEENLLNMQSDTEAASFHWTVSPDRQLSAPSQGSSVDALQHVRITCTLNQGFGLGNFDVHTAPIKTMARMREKLLEYAAGDAQWPLSANILDPIRASIVCDGATAIMEVVGWFTKHGGEAGMRVCRIKNKFSFHQDELVGGYRDLMICLVFTGVSGLRIIGEIQVQDRTLHDLKQKVSIVQ